ncbi:hypothetical protein C8J56DRAFT_862870 [Mycena floridula]|nr:hypothetical protein C8J56DRAFT_862870 [Mycena floridula]
MPVSPSDAELTIALIEIKAAHPGLGISKVHGQLLTAHPEWTVSEKRTRKILQNEGLIVSDPEKGAMPGSNAIYPSSRVIPNLDIKKWTKKVEVKYFNKKKGKGLVATEEIAEGETVWKEDPFVIAPEWDIYDLQMNAKSCSHCSTPFGDPSGPLVIPCPASTSAAYCPARFCNRLCASRSAKHHPLLCRAQNPASIPLLTWARETQWMALHAIAQVTSRILLAAQQDEALLEADWEFVRGLAELGMEERHKKSTSSAPSESETAAWKKAHKLFLQAFKEPKTPGEQKKLARLLKKPLSPELEKELFDYEAFSRGLGRMSLNLEAHGGLYVLHSHLNHSCAPNISVRHLDQRNALSKITMLALKDIEVGEELFITYVNPDSGLKWRRGELEAWGFGQCQCPRCVEEAKTYVEETVLPPDEKKFDTKELESELKAGLGMM